MNIFSFFVKHPTAANLLMISMLVVGFLSLFKIRRELLPDHDKAQVEVNISYPGATAEEVEETVCRRVEEAVENISYLKEVISKAFEGRAVIYVEMKDGGDFRFFTDDVKTEIDSIEDFPDLVDNITVKPLNRKQHVAVINIFGSNNQLQLKAYCEKLKDRLIMETGIKHVQIEGFADSQIKIRLNPEVMMRYSLNPSSVTNLIKTHSLDIPSGRLETDGRNFLVRYKDRKRTVAEFENLTVISGKKGAEVKLGDIAYISEEFEYRDTKSYADNTLMGSLIITMNKTDDILRIYKKIKGFVESERLRAPQPIELTISRNDAIPVRQRISMLIENGLQGALLVFLCLWMFFNFRFSFWVVMGLPVSIVGTLFFFPIFGLAVNMISTAALLMGVGLLMDDAIVISENIASHLTAGDSPLDAAINGTREVAPGVFSSFLTTVCIFLPLTTVAGKVGKIMWILPIVLILILGVSLIEAFLILPNHLGHSLKGVKSFDDHKLRRRFNTMIDNFRDNYVGKMVDIAIEWRYLFIGILLALFISSLSLPIAGILPFRLVPELETDIISISVILPQGTPIERTEKVVNTIHNAVRKMDDHFSPMQTQGRKLVKRFDAHYGFSLDAEEEGPHLAQMFVELLDSEKRSTKIRDLLAYLRRNVPEMPDIISLKYDEPNVGLSGPAIAVRVMGDDLNEIKSISNKLQHALSDIEGVVDIRDNQRPGKPEIHVCLKEGAIMLGLTPKDVAQQLRAAFQGGESDNIVLNNKEFDITVYLDNREKSLEVLDYFYVTLPSGRNLPLAAVAEFTESRGFSSISNINGVHTITVFANVNRNKISVAKVNDYIFDKIIPPLAENHPTVSFDTEGERKEAEETGKSLAIAFTIGILGIFVVLSFQFKSYLDPLFVMLIVPFSFTGIIWGHLLMNMSLSMSSLIGFVSISGVVVNDSILLIEFLKLREEEGLSTIDAAKQASRDRFRAVLLTSLTTMAGLLPLLLETSIQAQFLKPLAASIVFGLFTSTILVLFMIPALYTIREDFLYNLYRLKKRIIIFMQTIKLKITYPK